MKQTAILVLTLTSVLCFSFFYVDKEEVADLKDKRPKPNVVLILTDELGWQDVMVIDVDDPAPYETPNIDDLSKKGVMFWQAYSPAPTCSPSRCAIMSGNHPARAQKTHVVGGTPPVPYRSEMRMMDPWYSGRMPENEMTLARVLQQNGYTTGHVGKWHMAINHHAYPQPEDQGFDYTRSDRGATRQHNPHRLTDFATHNSSDKYRLDDEGFPFHQNNEDALNFLRENKEDPFFLYYATWLVHAPIHTRSKALLEKYCEKLGFDYPKDPTTWKMEGQRNPYYCAMLEMLDHYLGEVFDYLETTEDPRWPGHMLSENTYLILTSDNGGYEGSPKERITDNYPLDRGKISAMEGGTRVPLIITGPGIEKGIQSDVMINGLDFYPTILSLVGVEKPKNKNLDGSDLSDLLLKDPTNAAMVRNKEGKPRNTMMWHFPHGIALESTIRVGDYKLIRNYDYVNNEGTTELELYQLYDSEDGTQLRVDIEESNNLVEELPKKTKEMNAKLTAWLEEMNASYPYYNPLSKDDIPGKDLAPEVLSHKKSGSSVSVVFKENGAKVLKANLIYTLNGGDRYEEWFKIPITISTDSKLEFKLPKRTTHYVLNLIDENNFLVSYPKMKDARSYRDKKTYSVDALAL